MYDATDCFQSILVEVGLNGLDGCSIAISHGSELKETFVCLNRTKPLPFRIIDANVQRVVVADASRCTHRYQF